MANTSTPAVRHVSVFTTHVMRASLKMTLQEKSGKVQGDHDGQRLRFVDLILEAPQSRPNAGMGRTGVTVPAVHTSPRKFRTCNGLEVHIL